MSRSAIIPAILEQHAEEAAFLWLLRAGAVHAPHYKLWELAKLDDRVDAHLDGLRLADDAGWDVCKKELERGEPGEVFAATVLAVESGAPTRVRDVLQVVIAQPESARGLISALGWLPYTQAEGAIRHLLGSESPALRRAGTAAAAVHRRHPGRPLADCLAAPDPPLQARAMRAVGELGSGEGLSVLRANLQAPDPSVQFSAAWSLVLVANDRDALQTLLLLAASDTPFSEEALRLAVRRMESRAALSCLHGLAENPRRARLAAAAVGAAGYPDLVPWLLGQMTKPELARVSGEAFTLITGVDLAYEDLDRKKPEGFEAGPTENPEDEDVAMDRDENLPWPNPDAVRKWWAAREQRFTAGTRYLLGRPITPDSLRDALVTGYQRQRAAAAIELAILQPGQPLFEVRAPGFRQARLLELDNLRG